MRGPRRRGGFASAQHDGFQRTNRVLCPTRPPVDLEASRDIGERASVAA
jgi:hypothetical protein